MQAITTSPRTFHSLVKAQAIAAQNQAEDEDGWTYTAAIVEVARDYAVVLVYDEDGDFVGYL